MNIEHQASSLQAKIIGELDTDTGVTYFRGIPYASVQKRWTHSRTVHSLDSVFDATQFGPRCSQGSGDVLVSGGVNDPVPGDDELNCLNLNITVPRAGLPEPRNRRTKNLLPVMFWIHGGAFNYGANSVARYRPGKLMSLAQEADTPMVLVQIGYRLGPLGFAASQDLASEVETTSNGHTNGNVTYAGVGNYGFVDQRNALEWVHDHIEDFGGDPNNVTAFGISAGSASVHYHILTGLPLFDRAIMMSGSAPTLGPLPFKLYERSWQSLCKSCHVNVDTPAKRVEHLRSLSPEEVIQNYSKAAMGPMADGQLLPKSWMLGDRLPPSRCKAVILGDTGVEAIILDGLSRVIPLPRFLELVRSSMDPTNADVFLETFNFPSDDTSYELYRNAMRHFLSVMMFQFPNLRIAESYAQDSEVYLYHFEEPSPYEGPTFGIPYHGQCALYMYNNDVDVYHTNGRRVAEELARVWTAFAHGRQPWEPYSKARRFMRFGPEGESTVQDLKTDGTRDYAYVEWLKEHFEAVKGLAQHLLQSEGR